MAYSVFEHCAQGGVDSEWKLDKFMDRPAFKYRLERQICEYKVAALKYPGDKELKEATVVPPGKDAVIASHTAWTRELEGSDGHSILQQRGRRPKSCRVYVTRIPTYWKAPAFVSIYKQRCLLCVRQTYVYKVPGLQSTLLLQRKSPYGQCLLLYLWIYTTRSFLDY